MAADTSLWEQESPSQGWPEFKLDGASWIEGGQVWVLELQPVDSPPADERDLEETPEPQNATLVELNYSSLARNQSPGTRQAIPEYQHEPDTVKSCTPGYPQAKETFIGKGEEFSQSTPQRSQRAKLLRCDQCGKAFRYPAELSRHQRAHARQKAKRSQPTSEAGRPGSLKPVENGSDNSSQALPQKPKATSTPSSRRRRRHFCDQCGKAFRYPSDLTRHQRVHVRQKAAKPSHSLSEAESPSLSESTPLALRTENAFTKSNKVSHQNSKATTGQNATPRKQYFCDQCGKAFWYPSHVARHQSVHSRQKLAKRSHAQSEAENAGPLPLTPLATLSENTSVNSGKRRRCPRKRCCCDQCGDPSELTQPPRRQKAAKQDESPSQAENRGPTELASLITLLENISISSSKALSRNSKGTADRSRRRHSCDQCEKAFRYPSGLAQHQRVHSKQKAAKVRRSPSKASSLSPVQEAENTFTPSSQTPAKKSRATREVSTRRRRQIFCEQCGKAIRYPCELAQHLRVHSRQKQKLPHSEVNSPTSLEPTPAEAPVDCTFTNSPKALRQNLKLTTDQGSCRSKPYLCDQCGKTFRYPSDLARHQSVHSTWDAAVPKAPQRKNAGADVREANSPCSTRATDRRSRTTNPYLCDQCGEVFQWRSELIQHAYAHFQELPYDCRVCGQQFRRRVQLLKHQKRHEDGEEGEEGGERIQNVNSGDATEEYLPREQLPELPPERIEELCEPFVSPEGCECGPCEAGAKETSELLPANSIWEIGISGMPYLLALPPTGEAGCYESDEEVRGGSTQPTEPSLLQAEDASSTTLGSAVGSCEILTTVPAVLKVSAGAQDLSSRPEKKTSAASFTADCVVRLPRIDSSNPEWLPSLLRPTRLQDWPSSSPQGAQPYSCAVCSKRFGAASYLKRHLHVHQPGKPHSCTLCPLRFGRRSYLLKHLRRTHGEVASRSPMMCKARASKQKPPAASVTVARPPRSSSADPEWHPSLERPRRKRKQPRLSPQGDKSHSCPICSKCFRCAEYLKKHLEIHRPGKPHCCTLCGMRFGRRSYLMKHYRRAH